MASKTETVRALVEPLAHDIDVDVVDVQVQGSGTRQLVRVIVDRKGGVDLATCQRLSKRLSSQLDELDPIPGRYALEVTSPGVDHPLSDRRAFERVEGRSVLIHHDAGDGRVLQVRGRVRAADDDAVVLTTEADQMRVPYEEIVKATQCLPW